jgi:hypothetical protein
MPPYLSFQAQRTGMTSPTTFGERLMLEVSEIRVVFVGGHGDGA